MLILAVTLASNLWYLTLGHALSDYDYPKKTSAVLVLSPLIVLGIMSDASTGNVFASVMMSAYNIG